MDLAGILSPTDSPIIRDVSRAAKRLIGTRLINKKESILPDMIKKIEEVLHFKYGDITFHDTYVAMKVDRSKTDQLRKGNEVVISWGSSQDACPVSIFKRYVSELERFPVEPSHYVLSL